MRVVLMRIFWLGASSALLYILVCTFAGLMGEKLDERIATAIALWFALFFMVLIP